LDNDDMKKPTAALITAVPLAAALATQTIAQQAAPVPPVANRVPHLTKIHGYTLSDDYFWLREKANPGVTAYLEAENAYTEELMRPAKALQDTLYKEMLGRI
jgi:oligopeptidase B